MRATYPEVTLRSGQSSLSCTIHLRSTHMAGNGQNVSLRVAHIGCSVTQEDRCECDDVELTDNFLAAALSPLFPTQLLLES